MFNKCAFLKKYIESKEDLDAEIPSDDDEKPTKGDSAPKIKGLSKAERQVLGIK